MKRLHQCLLAWLLFTFNSAWAVNIYVSTKGSNANAGTKEQPLATIQAALKKARDLRRINHPSINEGIKIILLGGTYSITETIVVRPEDSGTENSPTIIGTEDNEKPIISGGVQISSWGKLKYPVNGLQKNIQSKIWVADVPMVNGNLFNFRQLWVNDVKAIRAKSANGDLMHRIISWNKQEQTCIIPTLQFANLQNAIGTEMFIHQWWEIANLRIKKLQVMGDSTKLFFHQPESKIQSEHPWPAPWISKETGNSAFYLTNAIQFLDEPGEWFLDIQKQKIYYYPKANENMSAANVVAPFVETLIKIEGTIDKSVSNFFIQNISFQHASWLRPSLQGHVPHQLGLYMTEAYKLKPNGTKENPNLDNQAWVGRQAAAIEINFATKTNIINCTFNHLAATAIDLKNGVQYNITKGNLFKDIGGNAIMAGNYGNEGREIHLPYNPNDEREKCSTILIENNFITNVANEDWGCVGIACGFLSNTTIQYNEVENVSYTGISLGWGWTPKLNMMKNNKIYANKIHHYGMHNYDCSGIYTLSNQPNTFVENNYVDSIYGATYIHLPSHWFYLYTDEGSSGITVKNNWTPSSKFLQNNNGENNLWVNNGALVNDSVKKNAGLQKQYKYLLNNKTANASLPINEERNEVIEIIAKDKNLFDIQKLKLLLAKNNIDSSAIYQWQNHFVIFSKMQDVGTMQGRLQNNFPNEEVKVYHNLVYNFQKKKHCTNKTGMPEWQHILLTANLVDNTKMQQEYIDAHATQFEKIPQIAEGFCNADFQQLQVFKNNRQLMLIISIPKDKTLAELNPKTTENNPQMLEWNKQMSKYQEGIEGTKKGETWVFLKQL